LATFFSQIPPRTLTPRSYRDMKRLLFVLSFFVAIHIGGSVYSCRCLFQSSATPAQMQAAIDYVCGNIDCSPISPSGQYYLPNTLVEHSAWAIQQWWSLHGSTSEACNFSNTASVVCADCTCALVNSSTPQQMQAALDWICNNTDCSGIQPGGSHYLPNTIQNHCAFVIDLWWQIHSWSLNACNFSSVGVLLPASCSSRTFLSKWENFYK